jgi:hypothetical protein
VAGRPEQDPSLRAEQNDLTVFAQKNIGREGFVSIAGTYAKARLVPLADASPAIVDRWDSKSLSIGAGYGNFTGSIIGRVVDVPGKPGKWEGLGIGLTWRTPWSGQLTVGAENVISRGKNPFSPATKATTTAPCRTCVTNRISDPTTRLSCDIPPGAERRRYACKPAAHLRNRYRRWAMKRCAPT